MIKAEAVKEYKSDSKVAGYLLYCEDGNEVSISEMSLVKLIESGNIEVSNLVFTANKKRPLRKYIEYTIKSDLVWKLQCQIERMNSLKFKVIPPEDLDSVIMKLELLGYKCGGLSGCKGVYMGVKGTVKFEQDIIVMIAADKCYLGDPDTRGKRMEDEDIQGIFTGCNARILDISEIDTSRATNMKSLFFNCSRMKQLIRGKFDTSHVTDMGYMFDSCWDLEEIDVSDFDTSKVISMIDMFKHCRNIESLDISNFDTSNVINMKGMFFDCRELKNLDVSMMNTSKVKDMSFMFNLDRELTDLNVSNFDTSNVTNMCGTFNGCRGIKGLDLSNFNTSKVRNFRYCFAALGVISLDVTGLDTSEATDMSHMFAESFNISSLDVSHFDVHRTKDVSSMFEMCVGLNEVKMFDLRDIPQNEYTNCNDMFKSCSKKLIKINQRYIMK